MHNKSARPFLKSGNQFDIGMNKEYQGTLSQRGIDPMEFTT